MPSTASLTRHAAERTQRRGIPVDGITAALAFGWSRRTRGAEIFTIGWRDVRRWAEHGIDLARFEGIQVVCSHDGVVLTVYRNRKPRAVRDRAARIAA
jgi:hypothetical protein